ncbi:PspC domain-containing protein [Sediminibacillus halophilus]|uniref:Phage shock protein C n=1 Tax=Sediminibacillus halophilus TaxID=482461 RepID=A0A1G9WS05_9BACI|nr:PspC domain-containing protein [Sediminibacillus halophilus]SDM87384.1 phage shock protein C [Sediminibacillus halophilus]
MTKKLAKAANDKVLYGVCGGIAEFFGISSFIVRLLFFFTASTSVWVYLLLAWSLSENRL